MHSQFFKSVAPVTCNLCAQLAAVERSIKGRLSRGVQARGQFSLVSFFHIDYLCVQVTTSYDLWKNRKGQNKRTGSRTGITAVALFFGPFFVTVTCLCMLELQLWTLLPGSLNPRLNQTNVSLVSFLFYFLFFNF